MQSKIINSRSVIVDPIFNKFMNKNYEIHKQKLHQIKNRKSEVDHCDQEGLLKRKGSLRQAIQKVNQELDERQYEKKSLINHIKSILRRKSDSFQEIRKYKKNSLQNEQKEILRQNQLLYKKISERQSHKLTKRDIKRQFASYQSQKNMLRKVKYQSQQFKRVKSYRKSIQ